MSDLKEKIEAIKRARGETTKPSELAKKRIKRPVTRKIIDSTKKLAKILTKFKR